MPTYISSAENNFSFLSFYLPPYSAFPSVIRFPEQTRAFGVNAVDPIADVEPEIRRNGFPFLSFINVKWEELMYVGLKLLHQAAQARTN